MTSFWCVIVKLEDISHLFVVFVLLTLSRYILAELSHKLKIWQLTNFMRLVSFYILWQHQKTRGFVMVSGGIERDKWHEVG